MEYVHIVHTVTVPNQQRRCAKSMAQSERVHVACMFLRVSAPTRVLSRCLVTRFLHRSSVGSLSRVRCWLGTLGELFPAASLFLDVATRPLDVLLLPLLGPPLHLITRQQTYDIPTHTTTKFAKFVAGRAAALLHAPAPPWRAASGRSPHSGA